MGQLGNIIGELIRVIGGIGYFLVFGGYYTPPSKTQKDKEITEKLTKKKKVLPLVLSLLVAGVGIVRLVFIFMKL